MKKILQIRENWTRDIFVYIELEESQQDLLESVLDEHENSFHDFEEIIGDLVENGINVTSVDDNSDLFDFVENDMIDESDIEE